MSAEDYTSREVTTLPLSQSLISKLVSGGFVFAKSLMGMRPLELTKEIGCTVEEAQCILQCVKKSTEELKLQSAKVSLRQERTWSIRLTCTACRI
jgi:hypothetical protein